jgi:hypothetical protein
MPKQLTAEIIGAAIDGFEARKTRIDSQIAELRALLSGGKIESTATPEPSTGKRKGFSAASRRKMAMAQKARLAKIKGESEPTAPAPTVKRKMSASGRQSIADAQRKRWAESKKAAEPLKKALPKKKMSAARKAALVANLAKARAVRAAKRAAA